jgi:hypothetical protein
VLKERLTPSRGQTIHRLVTPEEMGDRKPSQLLRHLTALAPDVPVDFLSSFWYRLPRNVQAKLAGQPECELDAAVRCADRISEAAALTTPTDSNTRLQGTADHSRLVAEISAGGNRHKRPKDRRPDNRPPSRDDAGTIPCWYHRRFGPRAQKCTQPCAYHQQEKQAPKKPMAASVCTTTTALFFVTDRCTKQRFLVDTGSRISVFPCKLTSQGTDIVKYALRAANGTPISTHGWLPLSLNLGLRRNFKWRFAVADVTYPLIGADFLSHFCLLVDCQNNRLLYGVTSPSQLSARHVSSPSGSRSATESHRRLHYPRGM